MRRLAPYCVALSLVACLSPLSAAGAASSPAFATQSGREIISAAMSAARKAASCDSTTATKISGQAYSKTTLSTMTTGQQTLRIGSAWTIDRVVGGVVYIKENAAAMVEQFGISDPKAVNRWISIPRGNSNFSLFNAYIVLPSMLSEIPPSGTLKTIKPMTLNHQQVVGVSGTPNIHLGLASGVETLYVTISAPHLPVELVASDVVQGQKQSFVISYSHWGTPFRIAKPSPSLPISMTRLTR